MDKTEEETSSMMSKINDLNLFNDRSDQELKKAKAIKQVQYYFATYTNTGHVSVKHTNS